MIDINKLSVQELKDYTTAQSSTITLQSKKITDLERKIESLESNLISIEKKSLINNTLSIDQSETSDTETACVVQIAMLKGLAMNRELTLEEVKKLEIFAKTLQMLKSKTPEKDNKRDTGAKLTTEQLLALASNLSEQ